LEKWKEDKKDARRQSLLKKEPRFLRRSTLFRLPTMGINDTEIVSQRVLLNNEIITERTRESQKNANQIKIESDIQILQTMALTLKYNNAITNNEAHLHY